jgi:hypothetical protein
MAKFNSYESFIKVLIKNKNNYGCKLEKRKHQEQRPIWILV